MWPFFSLSFPYFFFKKQDDTAHKGTYSLPLNLKYCILIFGFLPTFPSIFWSRRRISRGGGICSAAWEQEVEKGPGAFASGGLCSANCFLHVGFWSLRSCSQARFPPHALQAPSPFPHQKHQPSFVWGRKALPRQDPSSRDYVSSTSQFAGGWIRGNAYNILKKQERARLLAQKTPSDFVEESFLVLLPLYQYSNAL